MASTTFSLSADEVLSDEKRDQIHEALSLIAVAHGLKLSLDVVEPKFTYKIELDHDPTNPRKDFDNVGKMFCKHRRYVLGDERADDPMVRYEIVDLGGYKLYFDYNSYANTSDPPEGAWRYQDVADILYDVLQDIEDEHGQDHPDWKRAREAYDWVVVTDPEIECEVDPSIAICLPLYLYDHSGITMSHGSFSCPWDSGQVGWHYITKNAANHNWPVWTDETLTKCLEAELKTYDDYLQGNVWGYVIENEEGNTIDSCWGFYGDELEETGMLGDVAAEHVEGLKEAWERRFDR